MSLKNKNLLLSSMDDGNYFKIPESFIKEIGAINSIYLSYLFGQGIYEDKNGFFLSRKAIFNEIGFNINEQRKIEKELIEKNIISVCIKGIPAKNFYSLNWEKMTELMNSKKETAYEKPKDKRSITSAANLKKQASLN